MLEGVRRKVGGENVSLLLPTSIVQEDAWSTCALLFLGIPRAHPHFIPGTLFKDVRPVRLVSYASGRIAQEMPY